jgi:hypothetical protein
MSIFHATRWDVATDPRDNAVAVHRGPGIFRGNENIRLARFFGDKKTKTRLMNRQFPRDEVGLGRENVTIFANANDFAGVLELAQSFARIDAFPAFQSERSCDVVSILWSVIRRA